MSEKEKIRINNLNFLKDELIKHGKLECEYCKEKPLYIYDFLDELEVYNKFIILDDFDRSDGATADHRIPKSKGGDKFDYNNLAVTCTYCNEEKDDMDYDEWLLLLKKE